MDTGRFDTPENINHHLYYDLMKGLGEAKPGSRENHGSFVRLSCSALQSGSCSSAVVMNNRFKLTAQMTSGRQSQCLLSLYPIQNTSMDYTIDDNVTVKLAAYHKCSCDVENDQEQVPLDDGQGYGLALVLEPPKENSLYCGATTTKYHGTISIYYFDFRVSNAFF